MKTLDELLSDDIIEFMYVTLKYDSNIHEKIYIKIGGRFDENHIERRLCKRVQ